LCVCALVCHYKNCVLQSKAKMLYRAMYRDRSPNGPKKEITMKDSSLNGPKY